MYLAYLDQLSPRVIRELKENGGALPRLIAPAGDNIRTADFFEGNRTLPKGVALVVGNPPWGSTATKSTPAGKWCHEHGKPLPDKQIAAAFVWKAAEHIADDI